ncbi:MAG: sugar ABC transporter permease [Clostridiales bacterium]|nr:sugar ABC transporter permease [Clostridiales bacterium]
MTYLNSLDYLKLTRWQKFIYKLKCFFCAIPGWFVDKGKKIGRFFKNFGLKTADTFRDIWYTFKNGSWSTRVSFLVMGFGSFFHKQWLRGAVFLILEVVFILYMVLAGGYWLSKFGTLGTVQSGKQLVESPLLPGEYVEVTVAGDNSFKILLYGLLTIFFIVALIYTWRLNVKQCKLCDEITRNGKKIKTSGEDIKSLLDNDFHKTLLALPVFGITMFTVLPIIFMILVAFTNYDKNHNGYTNLFSWVGFDNFNSVISFGSGLQVAFGEILAWTLIWAFFATFSCYFLGMFVAIMINKKGIKIKKFWRTVLVMTIAVPQFISLLYISNLFSTNGIVNATLMKWGWIDSPIRFWGDGTLAKIMVLVINVWVGIPYLMLITTGILMNIPADLYESARIDGANAFQQFAKITLPYMLFVTGPYLLTSFVSNINNFNVIYLLTQGGPNNYVWGDVGGYVAGDTTILITWLFGITTGNEANYKMASVIGILIFIVVSVLSLVVFSIMPATKREDDFS